MQRRDFIVGCGVLAGASSVPVRATAGITPNEAIVIPGAYMLWYNRPSMIEIESGFILAYTTSTGDLYVTHLTRSLQLVHTAKLHHFEGASDHSAPSIVSLSAGEYAGHILVFFSNHASQLYCARSKYPASIEGWDSPRVIDSGRATYPAAFTLDDGTIGLQYTLQYRNREAVEWRTTVHRKSSDGGASWTEPVILLDFGPDQFPYSTPVTVSNSGRCALCYSIYSQTRKRNRGLWVLISSDRFVTTQKVNAVPNVQVGSFVPYEIKWKSETTLILSYSISKERGAHSSSFVAYIDIARNRTETHRIGAVAMHTYPGGAALLAEADGVIFSPVEGGLIHLSLRSKSRFTLIENGSFASPFVFKSSTGNLLVALKSPSIHSTRNFKADLLIKRLGIQ